MFTGIIKEIAKIEKVIRTGSSLKIVIKAPLISEQANLSDSLCLNGVCLTLIDKKKDLLFFEAIISTLKKTNLKRLLTGDSVNLEPALRLGDKLGGHFVLGHVDAELKLLRIIKKANHWRLEIELPPRFRKFIVSNGSITIDGISLTIKEVLSKMFTVDIIPFTYANTTLKYKRPGSWLNVEFDYLLKNKK